MSVVAVPLALLLASSLLALATVLEQRRVHMLVRMTVRAKATSPEMTERILASELAPILAAHGFSR